MKATEDMRMAELPPSSDASVDTDDSSGTPRWVYVFGIITLVLVLLVVIVMLTGGAGDHGPGRHAPPSSVTDHREQQQ